MERKCYRSPVRSVKFYSPIYLSYCHLVCDVNIMMTCNIGRHVDYGIVSIYLLWFKGNVLYNTCNTIFYKILIYSTAPLLCYS